MISELASESICCPTTTSGVGGAPVYLTPFLNDGLIQQAQEASRVSIPFLEGADPVGFNSWSGYISVGSNASFHLFFWYFLCKGMQDFVSSPSNSTVPGNRPLMVWLNGGPGISSMVGLFEEIGPLKAHPNGSVSLRDVAWTNEVDMIFIDNPMDTGFSYSDSEEKVTSVKESADGLNEFLKQFVKLFPEAHSKDLYIAGQSYAPKYVTELATLIKEDDSMKLKGILLGSGLLDPGLMLPLFPDYLRELGMFSETKAEEMKSSIQQALEEYKCDPEKAVMKIVENVFIETCDTIGFVEMDTILYPIKPIPWTLGSYLNQSEVQQAIHARPTQFISENGDVLRTMATDFLHGVQAPLESLIDSGIKVLVFNGQMDPLVTVGMSEKFLSSLSWPGSQEYRSSNKTVWRDESGMVAGYVTQVQNLTRVVIRNAGHRTAMDQPSWALDMMKRFINDVPF